MKKTAFLLIISFLFTACSGEENYRKNPYLVDLNFRFQLDLSLPEYNNLNYPGNSYVTRNYGINGVVVYNLNNSQYMAFELTDPNQVPTDCSVLQVEGTEAVSGCEDENVYSIITGQQLSGEGQYGLKPYRVVRVGNALEVSN